MVLQQLAAGKPGPANGPLLWIQGPMTTHEDDTTCRLRPFRFDDLPQLVRLDRRCFSPDIAYDRFEMVYHLTAPRHTCLLAVPPDDSTPSLLGFVIVAVGKASREGQIVTIDVDPDARRRGIGRLLLQAAEQLLAGHRNRSVRLQVAEDNAGAQRFYEEMGYQQAGRHPGYYADGTNAIEMVKKLSAPENRHSAE